MLSPYKLYKHDIRNQRKAVTWGPKGKPAPGCKGSICYRHEKVDWTVHRLTPALYDRTPKNSRRRKALNYVMEHPKKSSKIVKEHPNLAGMSPVHRKHASSYLQNMSPRWGEGVAPGKRQGRNPVPLPKKGQVEVSKHTKIAVGAAVVGYGGYRAHKAYKSHQAKKNAYSPKTSSNFHSSRQVHAPTRAHR